MLSWRRRVLLPVRVLCFVAAGALAPVAPVNGQQASVSKCRAADSVAVLTVASRLHTILTNGDTTGVGSLLAPDLRVLEGGTVETRQEYLSHHLAEDIDFAKAVKEERAPFSYKCEGNVAWLISTSTSTGKFGGREVNSVGAELLLLSRSQKGWKIRAIHWSSARRQPR
jgi:hypothetical protein